MKEQIKRIQEYVWARHVDGSDNYDDSIDEAEAIRVLDEFYAGIGNRNSPDQVYLGILLFESAFELPEEEQEAVFARSKRIFDFYKKVTGEDDWPAVEDRLEDVNSFMAARHGDAEALEEEPAPAPGVDSGVEAAGETVEEAPPAAAPAPAAAPVATATPDDSLDSSEMTFDEAAAAYTSAAVAAAAAAEAELAASVVAESEPEAAEEPAAVETEEAQPVEAPVAPEVVEEATGLESAAEEEERRAQEERTARRQATEAFVADLEVVDGMQLVPAGTSVYGTEDQEIFLDSFYIDRAPVTNAEYQRFVLETGYRSPRYANNPKFNAPNQPVVGVSLGDARQFARWAGKELPSERQWEKAARGADGRPYPWGNDPPGTSDAAFGQDALEGQPAPVCQSLRNVSPFGVCDMAGGVWEWTASRYAPDSEYQCVRGGSYNDPAEMLQVTFRLEAHPKDKSEAVGFRCVKNIHH
ncbi:MAG: formylglycine-generating enzyme family protein [Planctomycetota bacterium]